MAKLIRTRPLAGVALPEQAASTAPLTLQELSYRTLLNLRLDPKGEEAHVGLLSAALQVHLPLIANTVSQSKTVRCLWLGPDEWLVIDTCSSGPALAMSLKDSLGKTHHSLIDVSDAFATLRLSGIEARTVLAKLTPLDVHGSVFTAGQCAQTVLAKSAVILDAIADDATDDATGPVFDITTRRSFAAYVWHRIYDAGAEFGLATQGEAL